MSFAGEFQVEVNNLRQIESEYINCNFWSFFFIHNPNMCIRNRTSFVCADDALALADANKPFCCRAINDLESRGCGLRERKATGAYFFNMFLDCRFQDKVLDEVAFDLDCLIE